MASSLGTVYKSMEEYRSTCLSRSASPGIVNYGSSSTRTLLGTPSRYRSASPSIVNYGSSSTRTLLGTPSRYRSASPSRVDYSSPSTRTMLATPSSRSTSPSVFHRTMLATPAAMRPPSPSGSPSMATYNGFSTMRKVLPLSTHPAVSPSRIRVATTPSSIGHVHPLTANPSTSGQYPFGTHHHSQMHCIPQYETGPYHVRPHSQAIATTTWLDHGPTEIEADGHVVRDIVETQKVVEAQEADGAFAVNRRECNEYVKASLDSASPAAAETGMCSVSQAWMHHLLLEGHQMDSETLQRCENAINSVCVNFPGAMPDRQMLALVKQALKKTIPDFSKDNTLLGTSFCPDEISNEKGDLPNLLYEEFGKTFNLGGLAGIPFTGKTGFKAFASHVPTNGHIVICYGPHVAISPDGEVGKFLRPGQSHLTTACGACIGALAASESGKCRPCEDGDEDHQMNYIIREISKRAGVINKHPRGKMVGLAYETFRVAQRRAEEILDLSCLNGSVVLLGGIQINMSDPLPDFFLPLSCCIHREGQQPEHLDHMISQGSMFSGRP